MYKIKLLKVHFRALITLRGDFDFAQLKSWGARIPQNWFRRLVRIPVGAWSIDYQQCPLPRSDIVYSVVTLLFGGPLAFRMLESSFCLASSGDERFMLSQLLLTRFVDSLFGVPLIKNWNRSGSKEMWEIIVLTFPFRLRLLRLLSRCPLASFQGVRGWFQTSRTGRLYGFQSTLGWMINRHRGLLLLMLLIFYLFLQVWSMFLLWFWLTRRLQLLARPQLFSRVINLLLDSGR